MNIEILVSIKHINNKLLNNIIKRGYESYISNRAGGINIISNNIISDKIRDGLVGLGVSNIIIKYGN